MDILQNQSYSPGFSRPKKEIEMLEKNWIYVFILYICRVLQSLKD